MTLRIKITAWLHFNAHSSLLVAQSSPGSILTLLNHYSGLRETEEKDRLPDCVPRGPFVSRAVLFVKARMQAIERASSESSEPKKDDRETSYVRLRVAFRQPRVGDRFCS